MDERLEALANRMAARIARWAKADEQVQRLMGIPGIGPITATALLAAVGDVKTFRNGRELAAWLGLVPRQHSTGGREQLLGISKRAGDAYVRGLLIHGARAVLRVSSKKTDPRSRWVLAVAARRHQNVAVVALANRMARTAYALLAGWYPAPSTGYRPRTPCRPGSPGVRMTGRQGTGRPAGFAGPDAPPRRRCGPLDRWWRGCAGSLSHDASGQTAGSNHPGRQRGGLPGRPRAANGLSGGQAAGQGMTRWTRQQTAEGNRFQALRSDMILVNVQYGKQGNSAGVGT